MKTSAPGTGTRGRVASAGARQVTWAEPGLLQIRQRARVEGEEPGADATGPYWVFGLVRLRRGRLHYLHGGERVAPPGRSFAVFMPPWSVVRLAPSRFIASTAAVASCAPFFDGAPSRAVAWRWRGGETPGTIRDIARAVQQGGPFVEISREVEPSPAARRAKAILDDSYCRPVTLARLVARAGLTASVASRAFKRAYGMPLVEYRHRVRVMDAMFRLAAGGEILAVLEDVGFGDASRLYRHFRSLLCETPGSYAARRSRNAKT